VYDPVYYWIWVPDVEWAPAWVTWRVGGGYIGWAPRAPVRFGVAVGAPAFVFVETRRFEEPVQPSVVVVNNTKVINQTTVINNVTHEVRSVGGAAPQKVVIVQGPDASVVEKATGKKLSAVPVQEAARRTQAPSIAPARAIEPRGTEKPAVTTPVLRAPQSESKAVPEYKPAPENKAAPEPKAPKIEAPQNSGSPSEHKAAPEPNAPKYEQPQDSHPAPEHRAAPEQRAAPESHGVAPAAPPHQPAPGGSPQNPPKHEEEKGKKEKGQEGGNGHEQEAGRHGNEQT
jgi:hypothetical protein